jgi:hypothetical protein
MSNGFPGGTPVIVILHTPREKSWGMLDEVTAAGVFLRGLDLNAFDDWVHSIVHNEPFVGVCDLFFPMWRIERISKDESSGGVPAMHQLLEQRTGRSMRQVLAFESDDEPS